MNCPRCKTEIGPLKVIEVEEPKEADQQAAGGDKR